MANFDSTQLTLFGNNEPDQRELPLIIAHKYHFPLQHYEQESSNLYAVQDWIAGVAQTAKPRKFWDDLKRRAKKAGLQLSARCGQLPYTAADGKTYQMDYADAETLYLITQRMSADTGRRNLVLSYLAKSGVAIDRQRRNVAITDPLWLEGRNRGKANRKDITGSLHDYVPKITPKHYALATNAVYLGLWERDANTLKQQMGLKKTDNLRDHQPTQAFHYQGLVESSAALIIQQMGTQSPEQAIETITKVAKTIGVQARELGDILGIDLATGRPLIAAQQIQ